MMMRVRFGPSAQPLFAVALVISTCFYISGVNKYMHGLMASSTCAGLQNMDTDSIFMLDESVLAKSLLRTSSINKWHVSPWTANNESGFECKWVDFEATSGQKARFCAHPFSDGVSRTIETKKRFHHCNILPKMWNALDKTDRSIYLEIGANIGSCVMEMLLSTDAMIVAFEPHPRNQFAMRSTISKLDKVLQDRVTLVPIGLGMESATDTIYAAKGNFGNSVIGKIIKDDGRQKFAKEDQFTIHVERLDSIISTYPDIPLIKMDAQGYECHIVAGISQELAQRIHDVKFEVSLNHLRGQQCTDLLSKFRSVGFDIWSEDGKKKIDGETDQFGRMTELLARRRAE
jgi:FkbM family methyltransferase